MSRPMRILIMAGGTGGHVFPALAVADALRAREVEVLWLGTSAGLEARVVPQAGYPLRVLDVQGLRGSGPARWLAAPLRLALALTKAVRILLTDRPHAVLGMGGFVTGPAGVAAWLTRRPLLIHEQNAVAGLTNRLLAPLATQVMAAFPGVLDGNRPPLHTGNPVRAAIAALPEPDRRFAHREGRLRLLVLGGSQGASALNEAVPQAVAGLPEGQRPQIWHQTGARLLDGALEAYRRAGVEGRVEPFIDDMADAYGWADLVVCRSGALTVAELAAAGVGAILVPFPHAVDDHQTRNGEYLSASGAAELVQQRDLTAEVLRARLAPYIGSGGRDRLLGMARAARALARPDATSEVARQCMEVAHG